MVPDLTESKGNLDKASTSALRPSGVPSSAVYFKGSWYYPIGLMSWEEASSKSKKLGGHIATSESEEEREFLSGFYNLSLVQNKSSGMDGIGLLLGYDRDHTKTGVSLWYNNNGEALRYANMSSRDTKNDKSFPHDHLFLDKAKRIVSTKSITYNRDHNPAGYVVVEWSPKGTTNSVRPAGKRKIGFGTDLRNSRGGASTSGSFFDR